MSWEFIRFVRFQVFDDVAIELTMALLQFFSAKPIEEHLFRTLKALSKFVTVRKIDATEMTVRNYFLIYDRYTGICGYPTISANDWTASKDIQRNERTLRWSNRSNLKESSLN